MQKLERTENGQCSEEVIVFTLECSENECPGLLPEEKVNHQYMSMERKRRNACIGAARKRTNEADENVQWQRV